MTVTSATLKLKVVLIGSEAAGNRPIEVRQVTGDTWTETGTTWNNKPAAGTLIDTFTVTATVGQTYSIDVTSYVNAQAAGDDKASFLLIQTGARNKMVIFGSRENTANKPVLDYQ